MAPFDLDKFFPRRRLTHSAASGTALALLLLVKEEHVKNSWALAAASLLVATPAWGQDMVMGYLVPPKEVVHMTTLPTGQPGQYSANLSQGGAPVAPDAMLTLDDGTQVAASDYKAAVEAYLNSLQKRGLLDTSGNRSPLFSLDSTARAEANAGAAQGSVAALQAQIQPVAHTDSLVVFRPPSGARVPFTSSFTPDDWKNSWSTHMGDADWVALDLGTSHELYSCPTALLYQADAHADLTLVGHAIPLAKGSVTVSAWANYCRIQGDLEFHGQTLWTLDEQDENAVQETPSQIFPVHQDLVSFQVDTTIVPVQFSAWIDGDVGFSALVRAQQAVSNPNANAGLLSLAATSRATQIDDQHALEGAFALVTLNGQASMDLKLSAVADEFGLGSIIKYLDLDVNIGGASGTLSVDLLSTELTFDAWDGLDYTDDGATQTYTLSGGINSGLRLRAIMNPRFEVNVAIRVPTGVSLDFSWDIPPVSVSIDWTRIGYDHVWGSNFVGLDATLPLLGQSWQETVQQTNATTLPGNDAASAN